jgi:predicted flap endonuclease-1-like 5' DNA nuclease
MYQQNVTLGPGTGTFASHTFEILIMLLGAFLLGLWLGWVLWNRYKQEADRLMLENQGLQAASTNLNTELGTLKSRFSTLDNERADLAARILIAEEENNDLRSRVESMSQKIADISSENRQLNTELHLNTGEAATITALSETSTTPEELSIGNTQEPALENDLVIAPGTAPSVTLSLEMQDTTSTVSIQKPADTTSGISLETDNFVPVMEDHHPNFEVAATESTAREVFIPTVTDHFSDEAFEALTRNSLAPLSDEVIGETTPSILTALQQDDLKIVEGIGPKIEQLLFNAGIHTYSELAAAPVSRLKEILSEAGSRYAMHDPGTWSAQSLLAANGEWENLKAYQEFLDAGKRPNS